MAKAIFGKEIVGGVSMSKPTSSSIVTVLITIPFAKEFAATRKGLAQWHWKGIWVFLRVMGIFLMARLTARYIKSIIYVMSLDVIREATTTIAKFDSVKVYWVILWCWC